MHDDQTRPARTIRRLAGALASMLVLGVLVVVMKPLPADAAAPCPCSAASPPGTMCPDRGGRLALCVGAGRPGDDGDEDDNGDGDGDGDGDGTGPVTWCPPRRWVTLGDYNSLPPHIRPTFWDDVYRENPDATFRYDACTCGDPNLERGYCPGATTDFFLGGEEPPLPDPEVVAAGVWTDIQTTLEPPDVSTYPPADESVMVRFPTFVEVENWQGTITQEGCDDTGAVCVVITADPSLSWAPGEPNASTVPCEDGGTAYVEGGPPAEDQAEAAGACAHTYRRLTGRHTDVEGRPTTWDGVVTITWETTWETSVGPVDDAGTFGDVDLSTDLPLEVAEVSSVVVEAMRRGSEG